MNDAMASGFWFTTGAVAALGVLIILYTLIRLLIDAVIKEIEARQERKAQQARVRREAAKQREFAETPPADLLFTQYPAHRAARKKFGLPDATYPPRKPGITSLTGYGL